MTLHVDPATPDVKTPVVGFMLHALFAPNVAAYVTAPLPEPPEVVTWKLFVRAVLKEVLVIRSAA